ncbi:hypothetical protein [Archangium sp.]|uniref:hypothetical protein n=1 Tax=Archangium sp. TaxID=1872627 RepID=UPI00286D14E5|nr:hypothetical protein [Archangium sp.]
MQSAFTRDRENYVSARNELKADLELFHLLQQTGRGDTSNLPSLASAQSVIANRTEASLKRYLEAEQKAFAPPPASKT